MGAALALLITAVYAARRQVAEVKNWGTVTLHLAYIHIILSLALLSANYYAKFFGDEMMNLSGELMLLFGALGVYCFWRIGVSSISQRVSFQLLGSLLVSGHLLAMGLSGWLTPEKWYGGLPPISLLCFIATTIAAVLFLRIRVYQSADLARDNNLAG